VLLNPVHGELSLSSIPSNGDVLTL